VVGPIVFISRNRILRGSPSDVVAAFDGAVSLIAATKPRTALFAAYLNERGDILSVVHAFAEPAAMAAHFEGSAERSASVSELIAPAGFELYGHAPESAVEQLQLEASRAAVGLDRHPRPVGGFLRAGS
jgi:hypothetical protein